MNMHDAKDTANETRSAAQERRRNASWMAGIGAALVVALLIGVSVVVFAEAKQHGTNSGKQTPIPPTGTWTPVLQGYALNSIVAAANNPATLYACALPGQSSSVNSGAPPVQGSTSSSQHFTVLHSTDFGTHWQAVGGNIALGYSCQLAVNSSNSNDVYAAGTSSGPTPSGVLLHSTDGGQTWTTVHPKFTLPTASPAAVSWSVQQITVAGGHLFGIQFVRSGPVHVKPSGMLLPRLVTSIDGGQTWTILDTQLASTGMGVRDYAIDPSNTATIYELLGPTFGPIQPADGTPKSIPPSTISDALYKSTDGGSTWKLLLNDLPYGSQLQLAGNTPSMLYVGGVRTPLPYVLQPNHAVTEPAFPLQTGGFNLHMSNDGGATWHTVANLPQSFFALSWFVGADGKVYTYSTNNLPGGSTGTGNPGAQTTSIVATPVPPMPPVANPSGSSSSIHVVSSQVSTTLVVPAPGNPNPTIERYDPASNSWSALTRPPAMGLLLAVTPTSNGSGAVLWLQAEDNGKMTVYRYVAS